MTALAMVFVALVAFAFGYATSARSRARRRPIIRRSLSLDEVTARVHAAVKARPGITLPELRELVPTRRDRVHAAVAGLERAGRLVAVTNPHDARRRPTSWQAR